MHFKFFVFFNCFVSLRALTTRHFLPYSFSTFLPFYHNYFVSPDCHFVPLLIGVWTNETVDLVSCHVSCIVGKNGSHLPCLQCSQVIPNMFPPQCSKCVSYSISLYGYCCLVLARGMTPSLTPSKVDGWRRFLTCCRGRRSRPGGIYLTHFLELETS